GFRLLVLGGKYQVERVLGRGGYGPAYLARHLWLDEERVVKVLAPRALASKGVRERFHRELRLTATLSQKTPHVVRVYDDLGEVPGLGAFYVMEFLKGSSLAGILADGRLLPRRRIFGLFSQLCHAMALAHREGVVHRDLKPENLFVIDGGVTPDFLKIIDFGIAKASAADTLHPELTRNGLLGTPYYMSPEQCEGRPVDGRADLYSMGVILFQL